MPLNNACRVMADCVEQERLRAQGPNRGIDTQVRPRPSQVLKVPGRVLCWWSIQNTSWGPNRFFFVGLLHGNQTKLGTTSHRNTLVRRGSQLGTSRNPAASMGHSDQGKARAPLHTRRARWGRRCRDQRSVHTQMQAMQSRPDGRNRHGQNVKEGLMHIPTKG